MHTYKLTTPHDADGQPLRMFRAARDNNEAKAIDQLSGICAGILADGVVNEQEAVFFANWVRQSVRASRPDSPLSQSCGVLESV